MTLPSSLKLKIDGSSKKTENLPSTLQLKKKEDIKKKDYPPESKIRSAARTGASAITGYASGTPYGLATNFSNLLALGDVLDPEEMERIREISLREGIPFDEEKYMEAARQALGSFPTPANIAKMAEEKTGLPLTAQTPFQKALEMGTTVARAHPGNLVQKTVAGVVAPGSKKLLEEAGVPEPIAEIGGYGIGGYTGSKIPVNIGKKTKPSGLPERQYEKLTKPRQVSEKKIEKINKDLESDFRNISEDILSNSPIQKTRQEMIENPAFKQEVRNNFEKVEKLSESLTDTINSREITDTLIKNSLKKPTKGMTTSEYEQEFQKNITDIVKKTKNKKNSAKDLVSQYRKNNEYLSEYYSPGQSKAQNRAKKDAILEYNRTIAEAIEKTYPDTEFSNLFKQTNKQWTEISDAEAITSFIDNLFKEKPNYAHGKSLFESENQARPFKRALGEEKFKEFQQLTKDMLSTETPAKMLQVAKAKGFTDLANTAGAYIIEPNLGYARVGYHATKKTFNALIDSILDKPQMTITWKKGIDNLKKGNFKQAEKEFIKLDSEVKNY